MKQLIAIIFLMFFSLSVYADDLLDVDYNFIENAFDDVKPVTNEEFQKTINKLTPQPVENTFGARLKTFLFGRKYGVEETPKGQDKELDIGGEKKAIEDLKNGIYYIKLIVSLVGTNGDIIPLGNYKIKEIKQNDLDYLVFYQGEKEYGKLRLRKFEDNQKNDNELTYSRVDIVSDEIARVVYATISDIKCAYARIYIEEK